MSVESVLLYFCCNAFALCQRVSNSSSAQSYISPDNIICFSDSLLISICQYSYKQQVSFFLTQSHKNLLNISFATNQFSRLMQYFTFGVSISPCISPASFSSLRCCDTVALAIGSSSWISPK